MSIIKLTIYELQSIIDITFVIVVMGIGLFTFLIDSKTLKKKN